MKYTRFQFLRGKIFNLADFEKLYSFTNEIFQTKMRYDINYGEVCIIFLGKIFYLLQDSTCNKSLQSFHTVIIFFIRFIF